MASTLAAQEGERQVAGLCATCLRAAKCEAAQHKQHSTP
jgi:hypothetical protein